MEEVATIVHNFKRSSTASVFAAVLQLTGCGHDPSEAAYDGGVNPGRQDAAADGCGDAAPTFLEVTAFEKCSTCHASHLEGSARRGAPADVNFDNEVAAIPNAKRAAAMVTSGAMPPPGAGVMLNDTEKELLLRWSECR